MKDAKKETIIILTAEFEYFNDKIMLITH